MEFTSASGALAQLAQTPIPALLLLGGFAFMLLAVSDKVGAIVDMNPQRQSISGIFGVTLVVLGIVLHLLGNQPMLNEDGGQGSIPPEPLPRPEKRVPISRELLTSRRWVFLHGEGDVISPYVRLLPDGRIEGIDHPNESRWGLDQGDLVFYHENGAISTRFKHVSSKDGKLELKGPLLVGEEENVTHVLREL